MVSELLRSLEGPFLFISERLSLIKEVRQRLKNFGQAVLRLSCGFNSSECRSFGKGKVAKALCLL